MKREHFEAEIRPRLTEMEFDELVDLRDQLQADCDDIKGQIDIAHAKRKSGREHREWLARANAAIRFHSRAVQRVLIELGRLREEEKNARHALSMDRDKQKAAVFIRIVRERYGDTAAEEIWSAVDAEMSAAAQNGGSHE